MEHVSRRCFLAAVGAAFAAPWISWAASEAPALLDHILLGCNDLDRGIAFVEQHTGVRAAFGGVHPGAGTRNALLSLGERRYLEIIAPDPAQPEVPDSRDLKKLTEPRLVTWAAHPGDLEAFAARLRHEGVPVNGPNPGSRKRPDGRVLNWKTLALKDDAGGLLPFFIEWGAGSIHPSLEAPQGCSLLLFEAATPEPSVLSTKAAQLNLDLPVSKAATAHLHAVIAGTKGRLDVT
jgi:catechol 2,3-dioxygenase-like lactoylglutathione lyase family enzyme